MKFFAITKILTIILASATVSYIVSYSKSDPFCSLFDLL